MSSTDTTAAASPSVAELASSFGSADEAKALAAAMGDATTTTTTTSEADRERDEYLRTGQGLREEGNKLFKVIIHMVTITNNMSHEPYYSYVCVSCVMG